MSIEQITDIEIQLRDLTEQKRKLLGIQEADKIAEFRKLEWTKDYAAFLKINPLVCAGLPGYFIVIPELGGLDCRIGKFRSSGHIFMFGDEKKPYEYNITYEQHAFNQEYPCFSTSCSNRLMEFLDKVKFKNIDYDKRTLSVLLAAKAANGES